MESWCGVLVRRTGTVKWCGNLEASMECHEELVNADVDTLMEYHEKWELW